MALSRVHTWVAGEVLLASDLNAEYNNILSNAADLVSPFTKAISMGGFALNFDAANTIALTALTSGISLTGGTLREPTEDTLTAHAGGTQAAALALSAAKKYHRISVCATTGDSVALPTSTAGQAHYIRNDGAAAAQIFGTTPDTINGVATATGVALPAGGGAWFVCTTAGNWTSNSLISLTLSGNFATTLTVTATTNVTLPITGTLATLAGAETFTTKTLTNPANTTQALTDAASVVWDASLGAVGTLTLGGNRTMAPPSNLKTGGRYVLIVTQDGTGSRTLAFNAVFKSTNGAIPNPAGGIGSVTVYVFESPDGTNLQMDAQQVPRSALAGLTLSSAGGSATMTVAAGQAADSTNGVLMTLASSTGKTTSSWAVGSGNGGLDTGAIATGTWYHFYEIMRPDTGVVDVLFSTSASAPTMPTNYVYKRRIGSGKTDGSSQWIAFTQAGDNFLWSVPLSDFASANPGTAAVTRALTVPTGVVVFPIVSILLHQAGTGANTFGLVTSLVQADTAPSATLFTVATGTDAGAAQDTASMVTNISTNTSAQIRTRLSNSGAGTTLSGATHGWIDRRGRDD